MITASHNPPEYNGMKMVRQESRPISGDTGLYDIEKAVPPSRQWERPGTGTATNEKECYADFIAAPAQDRARLSRLKPLRVLARPGQRRGGRGPGATCLPHLPLAGDQDRIFEPDGSFPNGVPNPILEKAARRTIEADARAGGYDFGVAWDGDYDRCFFFDETGRVHRGLLHRRAPRPGPPRTTNPAPDDHLRSPPHLEHARHRRSPRRASRRSARAATPLSRRRCAPKTRLRRRDERPSLLQRSLVLRQRHDPVLLLVSRLMAKTGKHLGDLGRRHDGAFPVLGRNQLAPSPSVRRRSPRSSEDYMRPANRTDRRPERRASRTGASTFAARIRSRCIRLNVESRGDKDLLPRRRTKSSPWLA